MKHDTTKTNPDEVLRRVQNATDPQEIRDEPGELKKFHAEANLFPGMQIETYEIGLQARAAEVLLGLWYPDVEESVQWTQGGLCDFLKEKILQSEMRWDLFPQRICFFIWVAQTGNAIPGFGLPALWLNREISWSAPHRQEPIEQFRRELAYALCVLSYRIALERGEAPVEGMCTVQSVRESGAAAWVLSKTLVSLQEVWRSEFDEATWTERAYSEAAFLGSNRTDELRLLGNGVVPAVAEKAWRVLFEELEYAEREVK